MLLYYSVIMCACTSFILLWSLYLHRFICLYMSATCKRLFVAQSLTFTWEMPLNIIETTISKTILNYIQRKFSFHKLENETGIWCKVCKMSFLAKLFSVLINIMPQILSMELNFFWTTRSYLKQHHNKR